MRLFIAVRPPPEIVEALLMTHSVCSGDLRWVRPEQVHITLRFLGDADPAVVSSALQGAELPFARAVFGRSLEVLGRSALVVAVQGLDDLAAVVRAATCELGQRPPLGFKGHVTLARRRGSGTGDMPVVVLERRADHGAADTPMLGFEVGEVELISSLTTAAGAVHEVLERFPVAAPGRNRGNLPGNA